MSGGAKKWRPTQIIGVFVLLIALATVLGNAYRNAAGKAPNNTADPKWPSEPPSELRQWMIPAFGKESCGPIVEQDFSRRLDFIEVAADASGTSVAAAVVGTSNWDKDSDHLGLYLLGRLGSEIGFGEHTNTSDPAHPRLSLEVPGRPSSLRVRWPRGHVVHYRGFDWGLDGGQGGSVGGKKYYLSWELSPRQSAGQSDTEMEIVSGVYGYEYRINRNGFQMNLVRTDVEPSIPYSSDEPPDPKAISLLKSAVQSKSCPVTARHARSWAGGAGWFASFDVDSQGCVSNVESDEGGSPRIADCESAVMFADKVGHTNYVTVFVKPNIASVRLVDSDGTALSKHVPVQQSPFGLGTAELPWLVFRRVFIEAFDAEKKKLGQQEFWDTCEPCLTDVIDAEVHTDEKHAFTWQIAPTTFAYPDTSHDQSMVCAAVVPIGHQRVVRCVEEVRLTENSVHVLDEKRAAKRRRLPLRAASKEGASQSSAVIESFLVGSKVVRVRASWDGKHEESIPIARSEPGPGVAAFARQHADPRKGRFEGRNKDGDIVSCVEVDYVSDIEKTCAQPTAGATWPNPTKRFVSSKVPSGFPEICEGLAAKLNGGWGGGGRDSSEIVVINETKKPCSLPPTVGAVGRVTKTTWSVLLDAQDVTNERPTWLRLDPGYSASAVMSQVWALYGSSDDCPNPDDIGNLQPTITGFGFDGGLFVPFKDPFDRSGCAPTLEAFSDPKPYEGKTV